MNIEFNPGAPNPDEVAFHEAFADIVPLFLHFWESEVLATQIAEIRGQLNERSPLAGAVAASGRSSSGETGCGLRNVFGKTDDAGNWHPRQPDPKRYQTEKEPHARGDILVAAVFEAFKQIYDSRVADLRRLASKGTGKLPDGDLHPDLVNRFTHEASRSAEQVLDMCVRALDYLPPVEVTFGDFLRGVITADFELERKTPSTTGWPGYRLSARTGSVLAMSAPSRPEPFCGRSRRQTTRPGHWSHSSVISHANMRTGVFPATGLSYGTCSRKKLEFERIVRRTPRDCSRRLGGIDLRALRGSVVRSASPPARRGILSSCSG